MVQLRLLTAEGEDILIRFVKSGEVFGHFTLASGGSNVESAQVIQPSQLVVWERDIALQLLQTIPKAAINLYDIAVRDSVYFYDRSRRLLTQDVDIFNFRLWASEDGFRDQFYRNSYVIECDPGRP